MPQSNLWVWICSWKRRRHIRIQKHCTTVNGCPQCQIKFSNKFEKTNETNFKTDMVNFVSHAVSTNWAMLLTKCKSVYQKTGGTSELTHDRGRNSLEFYVQRCNTWKTNAKQIFLLPGVRNGSHRLGGGGGAAGLPAWKFSGQLCFFRASASCPKMLNDKKYMFTTMNSGHTLFVRSCAKLFKNPEW